MIWAFSNKQIIEITDINDSYITFIYSIRDSLSVPAIVTDERDSIIYWKGLDSTKTNYRLEAENGDDSPLYTRKTYDPAYFKAQLREMRAQHPPIIITKQDGEKWYVFYKDSSLLTQLKVFPAIQLTVIGIFLLIAYLVFQFIQAI